MQIYGTNRKYIVPIYNDIVAIFTHSHTSQNICKYLQSSANTGLSPDFLQIICYVSAKLKGRTEFVGYFRTHKLTGSARLLIRNFVAQR